MRREGLDILMRWGWRRSWIRGCEEVGDWWMMMVGYVEELESWREKGISITV